MNITNVKEVLKTLILNKTPITPMLWARHGVGKSSIVRQLGDELGYRVITVILSQKESVDLTGMLFVSNDPVLGNVTSCNPPDWFAEALIKGKLIIFLDEFNMARREVLNAAFQLVLDRELGGRKLPDNVFVVCAGNPQDDRYDVTELSESLRDRLMHIKVTADVGAWLNFAQGANSGIHGDVTNFIKNNPKAAYNLDARDDKFPVEIKHSFRSWERVGMIHALPLSNNLKTECIRGIVGPDLAVAFMQSFGAADIPLSGNDVIAFSKAAQDKLAGWITGPKMRVDLLTATVDNLVNHIKETNTVCGPTIIKFIVTLPDDVAHLAIAQLYELPGYAEAFYNDPQLKKKLASIDDASTANQQAKS